MHPKIRRIQPIRSIIPMISPLNPLKSLSRWSCLSNHNILTLIWINCRAFYSTSTSTQWASTWHPRVWQAAKPCFAIVLEASSLGLWCVLLLSRLVFLNTEAQPCLLFRSAPIVVLFLEGLVPVPSMTGNQPKPTKSGDTFVRLENGEWLIIQNLSRQRFYLRISICSFSQWVYNNDSKTMIVNEMNDLVP
jgi:hypothetical protein